MFGCLFFIDRLYRQVSFYRAAGLVVLVIDKALYRFAGVNVWLERLFRKCYVVSTICCSFKLTRFHCMSRFIWDLDDWQQNWRVVCFVQTFVFFYKQTASNFLVSNRLVGRPSYLASASACNRSITSTFHLDATWKHAEAISLSGTAQSALVCRRRTLVGHLSDCSVRFVCDPKVAINYMFTIRFRCLKRNN